MYQKNFKFLSMENKNWVEFLTHPAINIVIVLCVGFICALFGGKTEAGPDQFGALAALLMVIILTIVILGAYMVAFWVFKKFYWGITLVGICCLILYTISTKW